MSSTVRTLSCFALAAAMLSSTADLAAQSPQTPKPVFNAPNDPVPNGPTRPDPDGGDVVELKAVVHRDLALDPGFLLAGTKIAWGNTAIIQAATASEKKDGKCSFRYVYATRNLGVVASLPTDNRIFFEAPNGAVLSSRPLPALGAQASANSSGHVALATGTWMLYVHADATAKNAEINETNNLRRVRVTVKGSCN